MSKDTDKNLFITSSLPRLYQQLLTGVASYEALGNRIVKQIELAHAFRQIEQVKELARILINIPIKEYQLTAQYYLVWCRCRDLEYRTDALERIIEQSQTYKTKALFSRGAIEWYKGKNEAALYFYKEALKTSPAISEYIDLSRTIAVLKATEGFHKSALRDLEDLEPLIKYVEPRLYYDFLNSYAVELGEAGRLQEAENVSSLTIASPFGSYYPEWQSTFSEIRSKRKHRSTVIISLPQEQPEPEPEPKDIFSNVVKFPIPYAASDFDMNEFSGVDLAPLELLSLILKVVLGDRITDDEVNKICAVYFENIIKLWGE